MQDYIVTIDVRMVVSAEDHDDAADTAGDRVFRMLSLNRKLPKGCTYEVIETETIEDNDPPDEYKYRLENEMLRESWD